MHEQSQKTRNGSTFNDDNLTQCMLHIFWFLLAKVDQKLPAKLT